MPSLRPVLFIGPFPPPVTGLASINHSVCAALSSHGFNVCRIDTSPCQIYHSNYLQRFFVFTRAIAKILALATPCSVVYLSFSGGMGIIWELNYSVLCVLMGKRLVCHHHSFSYINKYSFLMSLYCTLLGRFSTHVFLGRAMADNFFNLYQKGNYILLSNSAFIPPCPKSSDLKALRPNNSSSHKITFAHMSNLSVEKGLLEFLALAKICSTRYCQFDFLLAGPFSDPISKVHYNRAKLLLTNLEYIGPIYSDLKSTFFESIDFFVFPTHYRNEAEPLVLLEAMSYGCIPLSTARGVIREIMPDFIPCFNTKSFANDSLEYALSICEEVKAIKHNVRSYYEFMHHRSLSQLAGLLSLF